MDGLFAGSPGERRRFVDRLVLAVDPEHGNRVSSLEKALRNRNRLLEERPSDYAWLDAAEQEVAEVSIAVTMARSETIERLSSLIFAAQDASSPFPWAEISLEGDLVRMVQEHPALEAEDAYRRLLRDNRRRDAAAGRTLVGPQSTGLHVKHGPKGIAAAQCSTGEQKALLVGLVLAHARLVKMMSGIAPLTLLDEVAAHFDSKRRSALFQLLDTLGGQVWMSGADPLAFTDLSRRSILLQITSGGAARI
jgi:DNA replication and repair protein RecF